MAEGAISLIMRNLKNLVLRNSIHLIPLQLPTAEDGRK